MKLREAFETHKPLKVLIEEDHERIIVEGFIVKDGITFFDIGWYLSSGHPVHFLEGKISGDGPWRVGEYLIMELERDEVFMEQWVMWLKFLAHEDGKDATRKLARTFVKQTIIEDD